MQLSRHFVEDGAKGSLTALLHSATVGIHSPMTDAVPVKRLRDDVEAVTTDDGAQEQIKVLRARSVVLGEAAELAEHLTTDKCIGVSEDVLDDTAGKAVADWCLAL